MKRRGFIALMLSLTTGLGISAVPLWREMDKRPWDEAGLDEDMAHIFHLALQAPSGHNTQPWRLVPCGQAVWELRLDQRRCLPAVDPTGREAVLSLGAFCENAAQAAPLYGYGIDFQLQDGADVCIRMEFIRCQRQLDTATAERLCKRRTLRRSLTTQPLAASELAYIREGGDDIRFFPREAETGRRLAELTLQANQAQSGDKAIQTELSHWIRWRRAEQERYKDGLTPAAMEMEPAMQWLAEYIFRPAWQLSPQFQAGSLAMVQEQLQAGAGWIVCSSEGDSRSALLAAGRSFEKLWLRAAGLGLALHPMTQALEQADCRAEVEQLAVSDHHKVQFLARVGHCNSYPPPVSWRRPLADIIEREKI
jgi:hypothetical protein